MPTLKIAFVIDDSLDKTDGVQQYVLNIGEWLRSQGNEVHYLVGETRRQDIANIHSLSRNVGVRFNHNYMSIPLPTAYASINEIINREQFDVIHVQMPYSPWMAQRIIKSVSSQTVVFGTFHIVAHSAAVRLASRYLAWWTRSSLQRFDDIVSVSSAAASYAQLTYGLNTSVLPNVVDYQRFAQAQPLPTYDDGRLTILFLGRLVARKGCLQLLKAVSLLNKSKLPEFRVVICGTGPLESQLKSFVASNGLQDLVTFVGYVDEELKPSYYASADIAVFPSTGGESFGIVLLEALATGTAVVLAGNNSGYQSVMAPKSELLFEPYDVNGLSEKLALYLTDKPSRRQIAAWGQHYASNFDTAIVGAQLSARYRVALRKRRRA